MQADTILEQTTGRKMDRQSNFELLRIVLMLMIVAHHFAVHGGFSYSNQFYFNKAFLAFFGSGGKIGVNCFVLISGYFLVRKDFSLNKLLRYILQIWTYSFFIVGAAALFKLAPLHAKEIVRYLLPLGLMNWFAHTYLILLLLAPVLNTLFLNLSKRKYQIFLLTGFFTWYFIPTLANLVRLNVWMEYSNLIGFIYFYSVGAYINLHIKSAKNYGYWLRSFLCGWTLMVILDLSYNYFALLLKFSTKAQAGLFYFSSVTSIICLCVSVSLFMLFRQLRVPRSKFLNTIAATTFGIYLIHDSNLLRHYIWFNIFHTNKLYGSQFLPLQAIAIVLAVFVCCGAVEYLRMRFLEPCYLKKLKVLEKYLQGIFNKVYSLCFER